MQLRDFGKKLKSRELEVEPDMSSVLSADLFLQELSPEELLQKEEKIFLQERDGTFQRKISRELLLYLCGKSRQGFAQKILDMSEEAVVAVDEDGRIFFLNQAYVDTLNIPAYLVIGRNIRDIEPGSLLTVVLKTRQPAENASQRIRSLNRYVSVQIRPIFDGDRFAGAVSFFKDVTELHHLNKKMDHMAGLVDEYSRQIKRQSVLREKGIVTQDRQFLNLLSMAETAADTDVPILITGENGVGKEVMANFIHQCSGRRKEPLITVNCAAIPENLMESELFGYEEGAFTGASKGGKKGKFELADGGTIFLDEIGDMPLLMQSKLLRVLQQGEIEKIGRQKRIPVNVRVIAATNQPLQEMIAKKTFRQDLFFRLNTITIAIPALRDRKADIPVLSQQFLEEFNQKYNREVRLTETASRRMMEYSWPGNVRELRNYIERSVILPDSQEWSIPAEGKEEGMEAGCFPPKGCLLPEGDRRSTLSARRDCRAQTCAETSLGDAESADTFPSLFPTGTGTLSEQVRAFEAAVIARTMRECGNNRSEAMKKLGISRRTFYRKLAEQAAAPATGGEDGGRGVPGHM